MRYIITSVLLLTPLLCRADWFIDFVRVTCIPESNFFNVEYKPIEGANVLTDAQFDDKGRADRLQVWARHGYYDPHKLSYECRLPNATYRVVTLQDDPHDRGIYAGAPAITLNLLRNGSVEFKDITFGYSCAGEASVMSIETSDPPEGWGARYILLEARDGKSELSHFKLLDAYDEKQSGDLPVTMSKVADYVKAP